MKRTICFMLALLILFLSTTIPVYAYRDGVYHGRGGRHGGGVYYRGGPRYYGGAWIGSGWGWGGWNPWWWGAPAYPYYTAPPVVIQQQPQVYVEPTLQEEERGYWYYCRNPQGYYPYVNQCPGGWMKVVPYPVPPDAGR